MDDDDAVWVVNVTTFIESATDELPPYSLAIGVLTNEDDVMAEVKTSAFSRDGNKNRTFVFWATFNFVSKKFPNLEV